VTETPPLDYAQTPSLTRRKAFRRAMIAAGVLAIIICGWVMLPQYWRNALEMMQQRQWMRYTRPSTVIAFEPPGPKAKTLFQPGSGYIMRPGGVFHQVGLPGFPQDALFLHARLRPDGKARIVWATVGYESTGTGIQLRVEGNVLIPGTMFRSAWNCPRTAGPLIAEAAGQTPRIYAGQPDPNDASHFTMQFEFPDGRGGTIHGRLSDDDSIEFQFESGPSRPQPSPTTAESS
jgi:hypothetical protein